ncbi:MAG: hypothetical protein IKA76_00660 [Clostridia bacterium]|nr:hypothetical protein [Clostridia bacterium]
MDFIKNGSNHISSLIAKAIADGSRRATATGNYEIERAIRIPSDFTLVLENCHLRMADGVYDNLFVNEHHGTELGKTVVGTDRNIRILGKGRTILDGGKYNGLSEKNSGTEGLPHISKNNLLLFTNVDGITIQNIACHNQRWWALNFVYCRNAHLSDIDFKACDIGIDENGNEYHGLKRGKYREVLVKNADGIDLRQGCHDFLIENITGFTEDDTIALTNLNGYTEQLYCVDGLPSDIANVTIRNVKASAYCTIVRLLNQGVLKLHDIAIENVYDTSAECPYLDHGKFAIRVGDAEHMYGDRHSTEEETYNISLKNITGRGKAVLHLAGDIGNLTFENIHAMEDTPLIEDLRTK